MERPYSKPSRHFHGVTASATGAGIGYEDRITTCHTADLAAFEPWFAGGRPVGFVHRARVAQLVQSGAAFRPTGGVLRLIGADPATRSQALAEAVASLCRQGDLEPPLGEPYPLLDRATHEPLGQLDRVAVPWFGVLARGVHLNGYQRSPSGLRLWVARRAAGKRTYGGHLDNVVAGGQALGSSAYATLVKEGAEEAGMPAALVAQAVHVGTICYQQQVGRALKVDLLSCFDLELPADFVPRPIDGEVEQFEPWPVAQVAASLRGDEAWKPNCALVALDFLLRRGLLDGELPACERHRLWRAIHRG
jgi:hypothetical protein